MSAHDFIFGVFMNFFIHTLFKFKLLLINMLFRKTGVKVVRAKDLLIPPRKKPYTQRGYIANYRGRSYAIVILIVREDAIKTGVSSMSSAMKFMGFGMSNIHIRWDINTKRRSAKRPFTVVNK